MVSQSSIVNVPSGRSAITCNVLPSRPEIADAHEAEAAVGERRLDELRHLGRQARLTNKPVAEGAVVASVHDLKAIRLVVPDPLRQYKKSGPRGPTPRS